MIRKLKPEDLEQASGGFGAEYGVGLSDLSPFRLNVYDEEIRDTALTSSPNPSANLNLSRHPLTTDNFSEQNLPLDIDTSIELSLPLTLNNGRAIPANRSQFSTFEPNQRENAFHQQLRASMNGRNTRLQHNSFRSRFLNR